MVMGKTTDNNKHNTVNYNYTGMIIYGTTVCISLLIILIGSKRWSSKERQQFRRAWRVHRKQFQQIQNQVETKSLPEIIEYYYSWKKYCPDEYRGRNRHHSEEVCVTVHVVTCSYGMYTCVHVHVAMGCSIHVYMYM